MHRLLCCCRLSVFRRSGQHGGLWLLFSHRLVCWFLLLLLLLLLLLHLHWLLLPRLLLLLLLLLQVLYWCRSLVDEACLALSHRLSPPQHQRQEPRQPQHQLQ